MRHLAALVLLWVSAPSLAQPCPCDCNADRAVRVSELTTGVGISMDRLGMERCPAADADGNASVAVNDLVAGVSAALDGCPPAPQPTPTPVKERALTAAQLDAARALWRDQGIFHYRYRYDLGCFCRPPRNLVIEVFDDRMTELRDPVTGEPVDDWLLNLFFTIDGLFDYLEASLESADYVRAEFDRTLGFPTDVYIDRYREAVDDELSIRISDLQPLQLAGLCRADNDCELDFESCFAPGEFAGCGACMQYEAECGIDADCGDGICAEVGYTPQTCACDGSVRVCKPRCDRDADCPAGEACGEDGHCAAIPCRPHDRPPWTDDSCPPLFACNARVPSSGTCERKACEADTDCGTKTGFCVDGHCHPAPGRCDIPPP